MESGERPKLSVCDIPVIIVSGQEYGLVMSPETWIKLKLGLINFGGTVLIEQYVSDSELEAHASES